MSADEHKRYHALYACVSSHGPPYWKPGPIPSSRPRVCRDGTIDRKIVARSCGSWECMLLRRMCQRAPEILMSICMSMTLGVIRCVMIDPLKARSRPSFMRLRPLGADFG